VSNQTHILVNEPPSGKAFYSSQLRNKFIEMKLRWSHRDLLKAVMSTKTY